MTLALPVALPVNLPNNLAYLYNITDDVGVMNELYANRIALFSLFLAISENKQWRKNPDNQWHLGRVFTLTEWRFVEMAETTNVEMAETVSKVSALTQKEIQYFAENKETIERALAAFLTQKERLRFKMLASDESELIKLFKNHLAFFKIINGCRAEGGRLFERVNNLRRHAQENGVSPQINDYEFEMCSKMYLKKIQTPSLTNDFNGFKSLVIYYFSNDKYNELLSLLGAINIPFSFKKNILTSSPENVGSYLNRNSKKIKGYLKWDKKEFAILCTKITGEIDSELIKKQNKRKNGLNLNVSCESTEDSQATELSSELEHYDTSGVLFNAYVQYFDALRASESASEKSKEMLKTLSKIPLPAKFKKIFFDTNQETWREVANDFEAYRLSLSLVDKEVLYWHINELHLCIRENKDSSDDGESSPLLSSDDCEAVRTCLDSEITPSNRECLNPSTPVLRRSSFTNERDKHTNTKRVSL